MMKIIIDTYMTTRTIECETFTHDNYHSAIRCYNTKQQCIATIVNPLNIIIEEEDNEN